jgi:putative tricarboxylic transport membrane protein
MVEIVSAGALGIISGIAIGLLPGIGTATTLLLLYPVLFQFDLMHVFVFYLSLMSSTQYYGSVSAIVFGVAGEVSSLPAVKHGHKLFLQGQGAQALCYTSSGSFFAAMMSLVCFWLISVAFYDYFIFMLKGQVMLTLLSIALIVIVLTSDKKIAAVCFAALGAVAGQVGYDQLHNVRFLTFGIPELEGGLNLFPIFCGLIIIPILWQQMSTKLVSKIPTVKRVDFSDRLRLLIDFQHWTSVARGGAIGFVVGLIPGCSYLISSNIASSVEEKIVNPDQSIKQLIAAESANNSGSISVLIPLLLLAIPIVFSEAIILGIAETKGFSYATSLALFDQNFWYIVAVIFVANLINWGLAGIFYNVIISVYGYLSKYVYLIVAIICIGMLLWQGYQEYRFWFSVISFLVAVTIGLLTMRYNDEKFVFVYTYFVSTIMSDEIYRQFIL